MIGNAQGARISGAEAQADGRRARQLRAHQAPDADLVLVEGAGSAAEINLREGDIANMGFARAAKCPVALIGDIDRGGIFAQILGAKAALAPEDAATIVGFIVNKFRGDASLFADGMATIAERTGWRALRPPAVLSRSRAPAGGRRVRPWRIGARGRTAPSRSPCRCSRASPISTISIRCAWSPACGSSSCARASRCRSPIS